MHISLPSPIVDYLETMADHWDMLRSRLTGVFTALWSSLSCDRADCNGLEDGKTRESSNLCHFPCLLDQGWEDC